MYKRFFIVMLALMMTLFSLSSAATSAAAPIPVSSSLTEKIGDNTYTYTASGGKATITGFTGGGNITTPTVLGGNSVTAIGDYAFYNKETLTGAVISDGITVIGKYAFAQSTKITSVTIPASVVTVSEQAFSSCSSLTSLKISEGVQTIKVGAFANCSSLETVVLPNSLTTLENSTFTGCPKLKSVTIPESIKTVPNSTFADCTNLTIYGVAGSGAEEFAKAKGFTFIAIGTGTTTSTTTTIPPRTTTTTTETTLPPRTTTTTTETTLPPRTTTTTTETTTATVTVTTTTVFKVDVSIVLVFKYSANGGWNAPAQVEVYESGLYTPNSNGVVNVLVTANLSTQIPERTGFKFLGWEFNGRTYASGESFTYLASVASSTQPVSRSYEVSLSAKWEAVATETTTTTTTTATTTVTTTTVFKADVSVVLVFKYSANGGWNAPAQVEIHESGVYTPNSYGIVNVMVTTNLSTQTPVRMGYKFLGWEFNGRTYASGESFTYLASVTVAGQSVSVSYEIPLNAKWEAVATETTTTTTPTATTTTTTVDTAFITSTTATVPTTESTTATTSTSTTTATTSTTLTTTQKPGEVNVQGKIIYRANGGTNAPGDTSFQGGGIAQNGVVNVSVPAVLSMQIPVRQGYKFMGWRYWDKTYQPGDTYYYTAKYDAPDGSYINVGPLSIYMDAVWEQESFILMGDVNLDGSVDALDASLALTVYAGQQTGQYVYLDPKAVTAGDVDGSGAIDASDASYILGYYSYIQTGNFKEPNDYFKQFS